MILSRRIKELWVFGPLGTADSDRVAKEAQIERDVAAVAGLLNEMEGADMRALSEAHGGAWERLTREEPEGGSVHAAR